MYRWIRGTLVAIALLLIAWAPDALAPRTWTEATQALTRAIPTTDAALGMSLDRVISFYVVVSAPAGQTLVGGGKINFLAFDSQIGTSWFPVSSSASWSLTTCAGVAVCSSPLYGGGVMRGRILAAADGVTLSGAGTTVSVQILAVTSERSAITSYAQP